MLSSNSLPSPLKRLLVTTGLRTAGQVYKFIFLVEVPPITD